MNGLVRTKTGRAGKERGAGRHRVAVARAAWICMVLVLLAGENLLGLGPAAEAAAPAGAAEAFLEGNRQYRDGDYLGAATAYERVLALGVTAPELEYNLGNAYLKAGNLGEAILHFRRALRQRPTYELARENLRYARSLTKDVKPESPASSRWSWVARLRLGPAWAAGLLFLSLAGFFLIAALRMRGWRDRTAVGVAQGVLGGIALLLALALVFEWSQVHARKEAVVVVPEVEVRSGPGPEYTMAFRLHEGTEVEVLRTSGDWEEVKVSAKLQGWAPRSAVAVL